MYVYVYKLSTDMYYYVLHVINLVAMTTMATMYMVNVVKKLQKSEEKGYPISQFYNQYWLQIDKCGMFL